MAPTNSVVLSVEGMSCSSCVSHVERGLNAIEGVSDVSVSLAEASARFSYTSDALLGKATDALCGMGYPAKVMGA